MNIPCLSYSSFSPLCQQLSSKASSTSPASGPHCQALIRSCIVLVSKHLTEVNEYFSYVFLERLFLLVIKAWLCACNPRLKMSTSGSSLWLMLNMLIFCLLSQVQSLALVTRMTPQCLVPDPLVLVPFCPSKCCDFCAFPFSVL